MSTLKYQTKSYNQSIKLIVIRHPEKIIHKIYTIFLDIKLNIWKDIKQ